MLAPSVEAEGSPDRRVRARRPARGDPALQPVSRGGCQKALSDFFFALRASPAGNLAGQHRWLATFEEYTDFVGLRRYRAMEEEYLPPSALESKCGRHKQAVDA